MEGTRRAQRRGWLAMSPASLVVVLLLSSLPSSYGRHHMPVPAQEQPAHPVRLLSHITCVINA
eukprot:9151098-Pyramimonas_sp.AAC.1